MPRTFVLLGWLFLALIAFLVVLFAVGYYTRSPRWNWSRAS